ncbi:DUF3013 family protein [Enterococcus sp. JM9B]|uniref:DUF3013 family protein n=1 Tax=Enterococcus sp. JM9B TaxID=1857216 RepID=UPI001374F61A|nr:DUF3013 family protein [Enterococcus sp. JM9B]KAF1303420.1 hypothetical protein BAU16_05045 [Enterococcus sp. JM9B]
MAKLTMLDYLNEQLTKHLNDYEVALDWDMKNHTIELVIRLFAENPAHLTIDDAEGVASEEAIIEFEDGILLYDPKKSIVDEEEYLTVIPYEGKKGASKAQLKGLVAYLKDVLDQGQSDLLDFLTDEDQEVFELVWEQEKFLEAIEKYPQEQALYVPYPSY